MKVHFLKTVWSDIIILEDNNRFALVDTGIKEQYYQLTDYLDKIGAKKIDFILLTHFHRDHYGNINDLVKNREIEAINGVVCEYGKKYKVPTPYNDKIVEIVKQINEGKLEAQTSNLKLFD